MSELYKLVFRGEVLDGQHAAVVRKRLAAAAEFDAAALDKLFSGRPVVIKRQADTATATRLQALFRKAGARLRVLPVEGDGQVADAAAKDEQSAPAAGAVQTPGAQASDASGDLEVLPVGSDVLRDDERMQWQPRDVDTGDLTLEQARFLAPEEVPRPPAPDVSHLSVAEAGSNLGADVEVPSRVVRVPDLDVAPAGADLAERTSGPESDVPDTSHLTLE